MPKTAQSQHKNLPVLVVGAGPTGLSLALELAFHNVPFHLIEKREKLTSMPRLDITNGRTMELFRRWGLNSPIRQRSVSPDHPLSVVYCTSLNGRKLGRFDYPSVNDAYKIIRENNDGRQALEPSARIPQTVLEDTLLTLLKERCEKANSPSKITFGQEFISSRETEHGYAVKVRDSQTLTHAEIECDYLVGCDGAKSKVRKQLGIRLDKRSIKEFISQSGGLLGNTLRLSKRLTRGKLPQDGRIYTIHFTTCEAHQLQPFGIVWHTTFPDGSTLVAQDDTSLWTLHIPLTAGSNSDTLDPLENIYKITGVTPQCNILGAGVWRPRLALANAYQNGRGFIAGDSAHQFVPAGGYGMNSSVADAVNLGWKLAATINGWGGPTLLESYETERRPVAELCLQASARHTATRSQLVNSTDSQLIQQDSAAGTQARDTASKCIEELGNLENEAFGIEFDQRYTHSEITLKDSTPNPPLDWATYTPSAKPGHRAPSLYLNSGQAIFDLFNPHGFTLLCFTQTQTHRETDAIKQAAQEASIPLSICTIDDQQAKKLYATNYAIIRPDQHIAWRSNDLPDDPLALLHRICGK